MDARDAKFGVIMPMPTSQFSQLGNVVYIDETGSAVRVMNIFEPRKHLTPFGCLKTDCKVHTTDLAGMVAVTTSGIKAQPLKESEYAKYYPSLNSN
jgi:hypothetical protein